ncbi:MAG: C4-type zinc ribbon domain-containing protein [Actinomycetota bacterium]|nr:C4-type zinc ribbon domain-containing protein [Actinomycetota bacterium]
MSKWDALLAVQEHDTAADQLEHRKANNPDRVELAKVMDLIASVERQATEVEERRHELQRAQQRLEDEITTIRDKATAHDKQLYSGTISNPRELQAMQDEIGALKRRISQLEDQELELMEQIEPLDGAVAGFASERGAADEQAAALRARIAEAEVDVDAELEANRAGRNELAASVDADLLEQYEHLRKQLGGIAIARLVGNNCGGCHLQLSAVEVARLKKLGPDEPANCEECGRLLAR